MIEASLFSKYKQATSFIDEIVKRKTERGEIIKEMMETLNLERKGTKWKPVTMQQVAVKVGHLKKIDELTFLLSICKSEKLRGGSFSKVFFGSLKVKSN